MKLSELSRLASELLAREGDMDVLIETFVSHKPSATKSECEPCGLEQGQDFQGTPTAWLSAREM